MHWLGSLLPVMISPLAGNVGAFSASSGRQESLRRGEAQERQDAACRAGNAITPMTAAGPAESFRIAVNCALSALSADPMTPAFGDEQTAAVETISARDLRNRRRRQR